VEENVEKGFRLVQCPSCSTKLRLSISEKQYGKTLEVTCPKCHTKCRTTIPIPPADVEQKEPEQHHPSTNPFEDQFEDILGSLFKTSKKK